MRWLLTLAVLLLAACTTTVTPPPAPRFPVTVYVADYGRHASLLVPRPGGELVEFAYGEWKWFALGQKSMWRSPAALFWPTAATLGRRSLPGDLSHDDVARSGGLEDAHAEVAVAGDAQLVVRQNFAATCSPCGPQSSERPDSDRPLSDATDTNTRSRPVR